MHPAQYRSLLCIALRGHVTASGTTSIIYQAYSMDYRERWSHARGVYTTQDTSRKGTVRAKREEEADKDNSKKVERNNVSTIREKVLIKAHLASAKDLSMLLHESIYNRLD